MITKRGQIGTEYIIIIGVVLVFFIPLVHYSLTEANKSVKYVQLETIVERLASSADAVLAMGPGSQEVVPITIPPGVLQSEIKQNIVGIKAEVFGDISDIGIATKANVTGTIPITQGTHFILVTMLDDGRVKIGKGPFIHSLSPDFICANDDGEYENQTQQFSILGENFNADTVLATDISGFNILEHLTTFVTTSELSIDLPGLAHQKLTPGTYVIFVFDKISKERSNEIILNVHQDSDVLCPP